MKKFAYQNKKKSSYFEGWYFRVTNNEKDVNVAIIFALTKDKTDPHSFIQFYDGVNDKSYYYRYPIEAFTFDETTNSVFIEKNKLSLDEVILKTEDVNIVANVSKHELLKEYQRTDSAMGFLSKAPLECFQEIIYMSAKSTFSINHDTYEGIAYMEKTFGTNFPTKWVWLQSNHSVKGSSISFSVGIVPVLFLKKKGFLCVLKYRGVEYRYGSFNFSKVEIERVDDDYFITIKRKTDVVVIKPIKATTVKLVGPSKKGKMNLDVFESIKAAAVITLTRCGKVILEDEYTNVGLELMYK